MSYAYRGAAAGLFAAAVLAAILQVNAEFGVMPELDFAALLGNLFGAGREAGWVLHFLIGATWGGLFAWLDPDLPGDNLRQRGVVFAGVAWFVMMVTLMPLAGFGPFGLGYGILMPLAALALHVVFGDVMGRLYGWLLVQGMPIRYRLRQPAQPVARAATLAPQTNAQERTPALPAIEEPNATLAAAPAEVVPIEAVRANGRRSKLRKPARRSKIGA